MYDTHIVAYSSRLTSCSIVQEVNINPVHSTITQDSPAFPPRLNNFTKLQFDPALDLSMGFRTPRSVFMLRFRCQILPKRSSKAGNAMFLTMTTNLSKSTVPSSTNFTDLVSISLKSSCGGFWPRKRIRISVPVLAMGALRWAYRWIVGLRLRGRFLGGRRFRCLQARCTLQ